MTIKDCIRVVDIVNCYLTGVISDSLRNRILLAIVRTLDENK